MHEPPKRRQTKEQVEKRIDAVRSNVLLVVRGHPVALSGKPVSKQEHTTIAARFEGDVAQNTREKKRA
jgi:transposase